MTLGEPPRTRSVSLVRLADQLGVSLPAWPLETFIIAAAAQADRRRRGIGDRDGVTRSTLFYAACRQSPAVNEAVTWAGMIMDEFASRMLISQSTPSLEPSFGPAEIQIEPELTLALRRELPEHMTITDSTLALALIHSAAIDGGLFAQRVSEAGLDLDLAADLLARVESGRSIRQNGPIRGDSVNDDDLSDTVRGVRVELSSRGRVTAATVVEAVRQRHPEYGGEEFAALSLDIEAGARRRIDDWLLEARSCFDMDQVRASGHEVLDGRLVVIALVDCDKDVARQLERTYFLARIRAEATVQPRPRLGDDAMWWADTPARQDMLGRTAIADMLVGRLRMIQTRQPTEGMPTEGMPTDGTESFLIHLEAPWGAGKSSLFELITERLSSNPAPPSTAGERRSRDIASPNSAKRNAVRQNRPFLAVPVNAWREQRVGTPWWTLLRAVQTATFAASPWWRRPLVWVGTIIDRIRTRPVPFAAGLFVATVVAGAILAFPEELLGTGTEPLLRLLSLFAILSTGVVAAFRFLLPGSKWTAEQLVEHGRDPMEQVAGLFEGAFRRAPGDVVFLIDDLDRCDADYVVDLLEVLQTTVRTASDRPFARRRARHLRRLPWRPLREVHAASGNEKDPIDLSGANSPEAQSLPRWRKPRPTGPFAIVAADGAWLRGCYHQKFKDSVLDSAFPRPLGYLFLEKFFQLRVIVPEASSSSQGAYLHHLLGPRHPPTSAESARDEKLLEQSTSAAKNAKNVSEVVSAAILAQAISDPATKERAQLAAAARFTDVKIEETAKHRLESFAGLIDSNPRNVKRLVNTYSVLLALRTAQGLIPEGDPLALWAILEIRWPELADRLRENPELIDRWWRKKLSEEDKRYFQHPDVEKLLGEERWRGLDAHRVRECAGLRGEFPPVDLRGIEPTGGQG